MEFLRDISLLIGIWVAIYGIDSWRREYIGRRRIELAEDVLALFYEAADAIRWMRSPGGYSGELDKIVRHEGETERAFEARKSASIVFVRYDQKQELFNRIYAIRYRFMAQLGKSNIAPFNTLHSITSELFVAARMKALLLTKEHFRTENQYHEHHDKLLKYEESLWDSFAEEDPINPKLEEMIRDIERISSGVIEGQSTLFGFLSKRLWWRKNQLTKR